MTAANAHSDHWTFAALIDGIYYPGRRMPEIVVTDLCLDSRQVQAGDLFFACDGHKVHGKEFIDEAITRGASVVLWESHRPKSEIREGVCVYGVPDLRQKLGVIAERFYGDPTQEMQVVGVTGTNGKTSVCQFIAQVFQHDGPCGVIGTLGNGVLSQGSGELEASPNTTPDAITLHTLLDDLRHDEVKRVVMEVSSHALEQGRVVGVNTDVAVFTNLTHEHLDYHGDMHRYGQAKRRLFDFPGLKYAVINIDDPFGRELLTSMPGAVGTVSYGFGSVYEGTDVLPSLHGSDVQLGPAGLRMRVNSDWGEGELCVPLLGAFNASNLLAALGALLACGFEFEAALRRLSDVQPVVGRMQGFGGDEHSPLVVVDYAHTPDALKQVLQALRQHTLGRLVCVFGCGGDRDKSKRPLMARIAEQLADRVIITSDNPRSEAPDIIVADILNGLERVDDAAVIPNRATAIEQAVSAASPGDVVLVAGKGHEQFQWVGDKKRPFSDADEVEWALAERGDMPSSEGH
ncbi:MAG: UDP-N-acetylmuramoyl-L-alanyl-D-glutamate--2,6-diaminopimelate ligase [Gammaproteobacteria bacterium]|nr:UDP-N-acetylmuramoyl-L-alanyl-D-glutamate--2,6-diaminopimelate ligase [Gammaproteobacteria bacterium]